MVFVFVTVTCPCSSTTKCHVNLFVYNHNNNNNNYHLYSDSTVKVVLFSVVFVCVGVFVNAITLELFEISSWKCYASKTWSRARTSSKMAALQCTGRSREWGKDLRFLLDNPGSASVASGWWFNCQKFGQIWKWLHSNALQWVGGDSKSWCSGKQLLYLICMYTMTMAHCCWLWLLFQDSVKELRFTVLFMF